MEGPLAVTSGTGALELLLAALPSFGVEQGELGRVVGVDLRELREPARISIGQENAIWEEVAARIPEVPAGIAVAERCLALGLHASSLWEYLGSFAPTMREAVAAMRARQRLETDAFVTSFIDTGEACVLRIELLFESVPVSHDRTEFSMMRTLCEARRLSGQPLAPIRATLRRRNSMHLHAYGRALGVPVELGAEHDQLFFPRSALDVPLTRGNSNMFAELQQIADQKLAQMAPLERWSALEAAIERMLPSGDLAIAGVARWMGMTAEALQRMVKARGLTWPELLDKVRRPMAERLLRDKELSISSVGYRVGFSTPASFTRAFRRWTGVTPETYRRST